MSRDLINNGDQRNYGATDVPPDVSFAGFSPTEFYNLCENIATNIFTVTSDWKNLKRVLTLLGTKSDSIAFREEIHNWQLRTNQIISSTTKDILRLNMIVRKGDKQQKLQVDKLSNDFKEAVSKYSSFQLKVADKMKSKCSIYMENGCDENLENYQNINSEEESSQLLKAQQMERAARVEKEMLVELNTRIEQIEADVIDVNEIMKELSLMVTQQGEVVDTIENCIETATGNIEEGTSELQKASQYQNKYRKKLCIIALVAVVIASILIAILVTSIKR